MNARLTGSPEPCTRAAAREAGWRFQLQCCGETLVLQHSGADGNRWQLRAHSLEHGLAVQAYKERRPHVVHGAIALWNNGHVTRFDTGSDFVQGSPSSADHEGSHAHALRRSG